MGGGVCITQVLYLVYPEGLRHVVHNGGFVKVEYGVSPGILVSFQKAVELVAHLGVPRTGRQFAVLGVMLAGQGQSQGQKEEETFH